MWSDPPPMEPREPEPDECCGQGCAVCVWDRFETEKEEYASKLDDWKRRQNKRQRVIMYTFMNPAINIFPLPSLVQIIVKRFIH